MAGPSDFSGFSKRRKREHLLSEINVTPMVDVMLVLLIIFIVTGQMVITGTEVELPDARAEQLASDEEPIQINVDAEQNIYIEDILLGPNDFSSALAELAEASPSPKDQRVHVRADRSLPYGNVMKIVSQIADAGFKKVAFISDSRVETEPEATP